jgi:protoporphyrinogen oxidase
MSDKIALIIGAGPAGLTAALELLRRTDIKPIVLEASQDIGGISKTVEFEGNRIDIGGHRFFSKSDSVMNWWRDILPMQGAAEGGIEISYQNKKHWVELPKDGPDPDAQDNVMLVRKRVSRILFRGEFFDYPLSLRLGTLQKLGLMATVRIGFGFLKAQLLPIRPENTLEDFIINRFGRELYATFFRDYTEKVWGVPCHEISAEWGAQRIKGLSLTGIVKHAIGSLWRKSSVDQKDTETSLIEHFLYPKYGPGHMWQQVVREIEKKGGEVRFGCRVTGFQHESDKVTTIDIEGSSGRETLAGDYVFSTMAIKDLVKGISPPAPPEVLEVAEGLMYRDFITVGVLLDRTELGGGASGIELADRVPDNWIYVQEPDVQVGRLQIFNNWSPYMVADPSTVWMGMEYFCAEGDDLWTMADDDLKTFAVEELDKINVARPHAVKSAVVIRMPKTYPAYFGSYPRFDVVRQYLDQWDNFFPLGRNGMHRYNNQDHSMLTAMMAVDQIIAGKLDRDASWSVNTEAEYHEEKH